MLTAIQGPEAYVRCVEQNLQTLSAAVDGCRNAVHLMHEELLSSTERNHQCHNMNMNLLQQRDELAKEVNRWRFNDANGTAAELELRQLNKIIETLQKRIFELERVRDDQYKENRTLKSQIAFLEAGKMVEGRCKPGHIEIPCSDMCENQLSSVSSLDLGTDSKDFFDVVLDGSKN